MVEEVLSAGVGEVPLELGERDEGWFEEMTLVLDLRFDPTRFRNRELIKSMCLVECTGLS